MKNLFKSTILLIAILGTINTLCATTNPLIEGEVATLINENNVMFSLEKATDSQAFNNVSYNGVTKNLKIDAKENIAFIEITNNKGELEFQMPIGAKILVLDLLDFEKGNYTVKIKMQSADNTIISSSLVKAF